MQGLKTGGVHKHKLGGTTGVHTGDAVARGLRFARRDADLLPDQCIQKCRFANVGLADNGNQAATLVTLCGCTRLCQFSRALEQAFEHTVQIGLYVFYGTSPRRYCISSYCFCSSFFRGHGLTFALMVSSIAAAAACSPDRREPPMPRSLRRSSGISHSTSKLCLCAAPMVATTLYSGSFILRP